MVLIPSVADARGVVQEAAVAPRTKSNFTTPASPSLPGLPVRPNEAKCSSKKARQNRLADEVVDQLEIERMENTDQERPESPEGVPPDLAEPAYG